ncbi:glycosyltransferase family 25 protein [Lelliottia nimipressuralis]|jgi:glycosyl transferase family 25|uniref:glycosyltransferase family 25 protein n=1 Tax=Lelliottia nimipressuralis TaxID=69220 RepID=UPI003D2C89ED
MKQFSVKILSLKDAHERRSKVTNEFVKKSKIPFSFFDGIYGKNLTEDELREVYSQELAVKTLSRTLTLGEIGATYSHYLIFKEAYERGDEFVVILEDDCFIDINFDEVLASIIEQTDSNNDEVIFIQKHTSENEHIIKSLISKNIMKGYTLNRMLGSAQYFVGAYGYIVTRAAMKKLLDSYLPIYCVCDHWFYIKKKSKIETFSVITPAIVFTNDEDVRKIDSFVDLERRKIAVFKPVGKVAKIKIMIKKILLPILNKDWE